VSKASNKAYDIIRTRILSGQFPPGTRLKEEQLCEQCGVSRTPIREALRRLHQEGLVHFAPHRGAQVPQWSDDDLEEVFALRAVLEGYAAGRAAERIQPAAINELQRTAEEMERIIAVKAPGYEAAFLSANKKFHNTILEAAGTPRLREMLAHVIELPIMHRTFEKYSDADIARSLSHHREIIDAFRAGDSEWARSVMKSHLHAAHSALIQDERDAESTPGDVVAIRGKSAG